MADSNETRTLRILASVLSRDRTGVDFADLESALSDSIRAELDAANPRESGKPGTLSIADFGPVTLSGYDLGVAPGNYEVPVGAIRVLGGALKKV